jgi:hypothetical protein
MCGMTIEPTARTLAAGLDQRTVARTLRRQIRPRRATVEALSRVLPELRSLLDSEAPRHG